jgi:hypothetical protein
MRAQVPRGDGVHHNNPEDSLPFTSLPLLCSSTEASQETRSSVQKKRKLRKLHGNSSPRPIPSRFPHPLQSQEFNERKTSSGLVPFAASEINN